MLLKTVDLHPSLIRPTLTKLALTFTRTKLTLTDTAKASLFDSE